MFSCGGEGRVCTRTWNVTMADEDGAMEPADTPAAIFAPGTVTPFTVTLLGTKVVPAGIGSVTVVVPAILPELLIWMV
ncbi:hypothetical protein D3C76_1575110 [compost metagenome]